MCRSAGDGDFTWNSNPFLSWIFFYVFPFVFFGALFFVDFYNVFWVIVAGSGVSTLGVLLSSVGIGPGSFPGIAFLFIYSVRLLTPGVSMS